MRLPNQPHPLPPDQAGPILAAKADKHRAKADQLLTDVVAEVADQSRERATDAARAARRARLTAAGVLKPKG